MKNELKISVIIPCFNMLDYIETTLNSVLNQGYNNLELIIVDGGSTDGTIDIIKRYIDKINILVSEKDNGQYNAINKGLSLSTGDIIAWINADDIYFDWTFKIVSKIFTENEDVNWISGQSSFLNEDGTLSKIFNNLSCKKSSWISKGLYFENCFGFLQQEGMFWRKNVFSKLGGLNETLPLAADYDLWKRFAENYELVNIELPLAGFRIRQSSRSVVDKTKYIDEVYRSNKDNKNMIYRISKLGLFKNQILNRLIRLVIFGKTRIYYYKFSEQKWVLSYHYRQISNVNLSNLILEL